MNRSTCKRLGIAVLCGLVGLALNIWRAGDDRAAAARPHRHAAGRHPLRPVVRRARRADPGGRRAAASSRPASSCCRSKRSSSASSRGAAARRCFGGFIVWTAVAATLIAVPSLYGVGYLRATILPVALQVVVSGLVAVVDRRSHRDVRRRSGSSTVDRRPARRLRGDAFHAFVLAATLPVLVLASVDSQLTSAKQEADGGARLHEAVAALNEHIGAYVNDHEHAVAVARRGAHHAAGRRRAAADAARPVPRRLPGLHHALRRRPPRRRPRDLPAARLGVAADQRSRVLHRRRADAAAGGLRRHPRPALLRADRHDRGADLRRRAARSPASPAARSTCRSSSSSSRTSARCPTRASPSSISTRA